MFGKNSIKGRVSFRDLKENELLITSSFYTLQGEGPFTGRPAYFIRLTGCNLACSWCDTYFDSGDIITFDKLYERILNDFEKYREETGSIEAYPLNSILVITGGEPTLQQNLYAFIKQYKDQFKAVQIETNGTQPLPLDLPEDIVVVCSPKCHTNSERGYIKPHESVIYRADCFKFVMSSDEVNYFNYTNIPSIYIEYNKPIYVSPMNVYNSEPMKSKQIRVIRKEVDIDTRSTVDEVISFWEPGLLNMKQNQLNHEYTAQYALKHGLIFNLQAHLYAGLA